VPTGNFGNILAAFYAKQMGLPVNRLICASNANNVLTDFLRTGTYDRNRDFYNTMSPSMDILISSNLERLLFHLSGQDDALICDWMQSLADSGKYTVSNYVFSGIKELFAAGFCGDAETSKTIADTFKKYNYLCDTHTAVAIRVCSEYVERSGDTTSTVIASTASPFKFAAHVLESLKGAGQGSANEFETAERLASLTGQKIPAPIDGLKNIKPKWNDICEPEGMEQAVYKMLNII